MQEPHFLATGIGSLPLLEAGPALDLIFRHFPSAPHWPQLPQASFRENFVYQFLTPLVRLGLVKVEEGHNPSYVPRDEVFYQQVLRFYEEYLQARETGDLEFFALTEEAARGFFSFQKALASKERFTRPPGHEKGGEALPLRYLKGQIIGPVTAGFQLLDNSRRASFYDQELRELLVRSLELNAAWQVQRLAAFGHPVIIFVDDSFLYVYGTANFLALTREDITTSLEAIFGAIREQGGLPGAHICSQTDWSLLLDSSLEILNLDAYNYFSSLLPYAEKLTAFLQRGGVVAWGIVPTSPRAKEENVASLRGRYLGYLDALERQGVPRELLLSRSMITPSCGTGLLPPELAQRIYELTQALAGDLQARFPGS